LFELARFRSQRANPGVHSRALIPRTDASHRSVLAQLPRIVRTFETGSRAENLALCLLRRHEQAGSKRRTVAPSPREPPSATTPPLPRGRREAMETRAGVVVSPRPARSTHDDGSLSSPWSGIRTFVFPPHGGPMSRTDMMTRAHTLLAYHSRNAQTLITQVCHIRRVERARDEGSCLSSVLGVGTRYRAFQVPCREGGGGQDQGLSRGNAVESTQRPHSAGR
jgi:hypothetical protein